MQRVLDEAVMIGGRGQEVAPCALLDESERVQNAFLGRAGTGGKIDGPELSPAQQRFLDGFQHTRLDGWRQERQAGLNVAHKVRPFGVGVLRQAAELVAGSVEAAFQSRHEDGRHQLAEQVLQQPEGHRLSQCNARNIEAGVGFPIPAVGHRNVIALQRENDRQFGQIPLDRALGDHVAGVFQALTQFAGCDTRTVAGDELEQFPLTGKGGFAAVAWHGRGSVGAGCLNRHRQPGWQLGRSGEGVWIGMGSRPWRFCFRARLWHVEATKYVVIELFFQWGAFPVRFWVFR